MITHAAKKILGKLCKNCPSWFLDNSAAFAYICNGYDEDERERSRSLFLCPQLKRNG